jgi:hypothetical protein
MGTWRQGGREKPATQPFKIRYLALGHVSGMYSKDEQMMDKDEVDELWRISTWSEGDDPGLLNCMQ